MNSNRRRKSRIRVRRRRACLRRCRARCRRAAALRTARRAVKASQATTGSAHRCFATRSEHASPSGVTLGTSTPCQCHCSLNCLRVDVTLPNRSASLSDATGCHATDTVSCVLGSVVACPRTPLRSVRAHVIAIAIAQLHYPSHAVLYLRPVDSDSDTPSNVPSLASAAVLSALNHGTTHDDVSESAGPGLDSERLTLADLFQASNGHDLSHSREGVQDVVQIAVIRLDCLLGGAGAPTGVQSGGLPVNKAATLAHLIKQVPGAAREVSISSAILSHRGRVAIDGNALFMKLLRSRQRRTTWQDLVTLVTHNAECLVSQLTEWGDKSPLVANTLKALEQLHLTGTRSVSNAALSAAARRLAKQLVQRVSELATQEDIAELVVVFDGPVAPSKRRVWLKRRNLESLLSFAAAVYDARQEAQRHRDQDTDSETAESHGLAAGLDLSAVALGCKILSVTAFLKDAVVEEVAATLSDLASVEITDHEADVRLAELGRDGYLVVSDDADIPFDGSPHLFRKLSFRDGTGLYVNMQTVMSHADSPAEGLLPVDFTIVSALVGNESSLVHLNGVGPKSVWKCMRSALSSVPLKTAPTVAHRLHRVLQQEPFSVQQLPPSFFYLTLLSIASRLALCIPPDFSQVRSIRFNLPQSITLCSQEVWSKVLRTAIPAGVIPYLQPISNDGTPRAAIGQDLLASMVSISSESSLPLSLPGSTGLLVQRVGTAPSGDCLLRLAMQLRQRQLDCIRYACTVNERLTIGSVASTTTQPLVIWSATGQLMAGIVGNSASGICDAIGRYADIHRVHSSAFTSPTSDRVADLEAIAYDVDVAVKSDLGVGWHSGSSPVRTVCESVWPAGTRSAGMSVQQVFDISTSARTIRFVYYRTNARTTEAGPPLLSSALQSDFFVQYPNSGELTARQLSVGRGGGAGSTSCTLNALSPLFGECIASRGPVWHWFASTMCTVIDAEVRALLPQVLTIERR